MCNESLITINLLMLINTHPLRHSQYFCHNELKLAALLLVKMYNMLTGGHFNIPLTVGASACNTRQMHK